MASVEQPLKKRRLYEPEPEPETKPAPSPSPVRSPSPPAEVCADRRSFETLQSLSEEEILERRRNREEIRSVYECYKRIRFRLAQKDSVLIPDLEQAYHYLISASRGCTSVQRIVADLIPRFSSCCPTALEAASKVVINMHDCSLAVINRGEDADAVAFQTAKSCILGLFDICRIASLEAKKSSVIQEICSAVFQNLLTFFSSSFEGKDIFLISGKDIVKMLDSADVFNELKEKIFDENMSAPIILFKLSALSLLRIFFRYPKNLLAACFHVLQSTAAEEFHKEGLYFLSQVTRKLDLDVAHSLTNTSHEHELNETNRSSHEATHQALVSDDNNVAAAPSPVSGSCLLELVIGKDPTLQSWMLPKYRKLCKSSASNALSDIISVMEAIFKSYAEVMTAEDDQIDSDVEGPCTDRSCLHPGFSQPEMSIENSRADSDLKIRDGCHDAFHNISGKHLKSQCPIFPVETNVQPVSCNQDISGSRPMDCSTVDHGDKSLSRTPVPWDVMNQQMPSPVTRTPADIRTNSLGSPAMRSSGGGAINSFASPKHHLAAPCTSTTTHNVWYFDGDPTTMDIVSVSKLLWVGLLGSDASEAHLSFQIERFGPVEQYIFFPLKGFAVVEYRSILDAIRAREYIRKQFHWCIKFMDIGLGTRGAVNGVAVGSNCHIYVGNISSHWAKEEILHESRKVVYKGPYMVTDLSNEGALLMEFETPEEAAAVMNHLRQLRRERNSNQHSFHVGPANHSMSHVDGGMSLPTPAHVDFRNSHPGNTPNSYMRSPQIEFSQSVMHPTGSFMIRPGSCNMEIVSPRTNFDNHGTTVQAGHPYHSSRGIFGSTEMHEAGTRKNDGCNKNVVVDSLQAGTNVSIAMEQNWSYTKSEVVPQSAPSSIPCFHATLQGPPAPLPPQVQPPPFVRPAYVPSNSAWDVRAIHHNFPLSSIPHGAVHNSFHGNAVAAPPFVPASVTPVMQIQGTPMQHYDQVFSSPVAPPLSSLLPPLPEVPPPLSPSPPPLPQSQPPFVPPPPSSPPPPLPIGESSEGEIAGHFSQFRWQGTLCKSGVHYCTIYARRVDSDACKYINAVAEPTEWPAKLDMIKRTDIGHVKSTFTNTPPHKREVCKLTPSTTEDHKGFQDFISYLKQRGCAGVIKIPAVKSIWARLIYIIPNSPDMCSMLSITPSSLDCLIALVLPKETNFEWV